MRMTLDLLDKMWWKFAQNIDKLPLYQNIKLYWIIFRIDMFIAKTKMVSV